jgi:hypothetical protein
MKLKNSADMKWYLYRSDAKLKMLFGQIARNEGKKTIEWKTAFGRSVSRLSKLEKDADVDEDDMLKAIIQELEYAKQVGTIYEPNLYIKGVMPMRWGMYNDAGRCDPDTGPLVYFGGLDAEQQILLGLGGSSKHVMGHEGATSTYSRSSTPALVTALCRGIESGTRELPQKDDPRAAEDEVYKAMAIAQHYLRPPTQNLEFFARTLMTGKTSNCELYIGIPTVRVILGTPLYVALAAPYPNDDHWGLIPD